MTEWVIRKENIYSYESNSRIYTTLCFYDDDELPCNLIVIVST